jgi:prepilin-type N-terminal cleavage/methylation domain-containing protein
MMLRLKRLDQGGVTLVELLIVMGLLAIFLTLLATIFTATLDIEGQTQSYSAITSDGRFVTTRLEYDISHASSITTPATLGTSGTSLELTIGSGTYTYDLHGNAMELTDPTGAANLTGDGVKVSDLSFQTVGNVGGKPTVRYSFKLTSTSLDNGHADTQEFEGTAGLR